MPKKHAAKKEKERSKTCCFCFRSKGKKKKRAQDNDEGPAPHQQEYEYIIEKLAIKKIPIRDYSPSQRRPIILNERPMYNDEEYMEDREIAPQIYHVHQYDPQIIMQNQSMNSPRSERTHKHPSNKHKEIEQEKEMVSHILHSLSTIEEKPPIKTKRSPRSSPRNSPRKEYSPPIIKVPQPDFIQAKHHRKVVCANVHKAPPKFDNEAMGMSEELRDTIHALGAAQPLLNINPKNKKAMKLKSPPLIVPKEQEVPKDSYEALIEDNSQELRCIALDKDVDLILHKCCEHHVHGDSRLRTVLPNPDQPKEPPRNILPKQFVPQPPPNIMPRQFMPQPPPRRPPPRIKPRSPPRYVPVVPVMPVKEIMEPEPYFSDDLYESESLLKVLEEENNVAVLPSQFSFGDVCTSTDIQSLKHEEKPREKQVRQPSPPRNQTRKKSPPNIIKSSEEPISLNNLKGQNLKWKIIIKHHDDDE